MKLIRLSEEHYVVVDKSETKPCQPANICMAHKTKVCDKCCRYLGMVVVKKPDLSEVEEAIYGYSVEKMAIKDLENFFGSNLELTEKGEKWVEGYKIGFNAHKELVKDKLFTIEDVREAIKMAWEADSKDGTVDLNIVLSYGNNNDLRTKWTEEEIIQSLLPKPEWEVKFDEQGKLKLV